MTSAPNADQKERSVEAPLGTRCFQYESWARGALCHFKLPREYITGKPTRRRSVN